MNYLDGFSGYGGFHYAFERAGWKFDKCYYSEIDKHAIANYSYNFPNSIYAGSIDTICQSGIITNLDLFTFGWPCQDNSIAGKRKGQQSGTRSGLLYEAVNIIDKFKPRNFVAENVAGLLSVNKGIDIIESFKILSYLNESMPQYDIEMQLLNTRWFLPQNRERLFFVGHLRGSGSRQIFPIGDSDSQISETGDGKDFAGCISTKNASGQCQFDGSTTLIKSATKSGYEIAEVGDSINLSVPESKTRRGRVGKGVAQTLDTSCNQGTITPMRWVRTDEGKQARRENQKNGRDYTPFNSGHRELVKSDDSAIGCITNALNKDCLLGVTISNTNMNGESFENEHAGTLRAGASHNYQLVNNIRRLTPLECERLQGLPDNWTQFGNYDGQIKEISDTQRYRLCGNGVSIPVVQAIAERLR